MPDLTPDAPDVVAQAPQSKVGGDAFARPQAVGLSPGLEALGAGLEDLAVPLAKAQAADDVASGSSDPTKPGVVRDADGTPQAATPGSSFILGRAGDAYNEAAKVGYQAKYSAAISQQLTDFHAAAQAKNDPQQFLTVANAYAEQIREANPGALGNALAAQTHNEASQRYAGLVEQKASLDLHDDLQAVQTHISSLNNDLTVMAQKGLVGTDEYNSELDQLNRSYDALAGNPRFGYTPDKIAAEKARATSMLDGEFITGRIDDTFNKKGKAAAFDAVKTGIDENQDLKVSPEDRNHLHNLAMARLSYLSQEQTSALAAMRPLIDSQTKKLVAGNLGPDRVSDQELDGTLQQLDGMGAIKEAQELRAAVTVSSRMQAVRNLPPDQRAAALLGPGPGPGAGGSEQQAMDFFQSKGWTPAQAAGIVGNLARESGLNAGALNKGDGSDGSDSIGIGQWNGSRAVALKQFATQQGRSPNDFNTQLAFVQHELETSEGNAATMLRGATTPKDAASAFALGYERPQGFLTGDISKVSGGLDRVNNAVRLADGGASSSIVAPQSTQQQPFTDAEAQANPWLRTAYRQALQVDGAQQVAFATAQFKTLENNIKFTGNPGPAIIGPAATVLQIADQHPELAPQAAKLRGALAGQPAGFAAAGTPDGGATLLDHVNDVVRAAPGSLLALSYGEHAKAGVEAGRKMLADDHNEYAVQAQWIPQRPAPLAFGPPGTPVADMVQGLVPAMVQRGAGANEVTTHVGVPTPLFPKSELPMVKSIAVNGTADQQLALATSIVNANVTQPVLKATIAQLGASKETQPLAAAGNVYKDNPEVAHNIIVGANLMRADPKLAPNKDDFPSAFAAKLSFNDLPGTQAREQMDTAIQAAYAKASADANDTTGILNQARLDKAVEDVTGGLATHRGAPLSAPGTARAKPVSTAPCAP